MNVFRKLNRTLFMVGTYTDAIVALIFIQLSCGLKHDNIRLLDELYVIDPFWHDTADLTMEGYLQLIKSLKARGIDPINVEEGLNHIARTSAEKAINDNAELEL